MAWEDVFDSVRFDSLLSVFDDFIIDVDSECVMLLTDLLCAPLTVETTLDPLSSFDDTCTNFPPIILDVVDCLPLLDVSSPRTILELPRC